MYTYIHLCVCVREEKQYFLNTCIYLYNYKYDLTQHYEIRNPQKIPMSSFSFVHLPLGMQSTIKSSMFSQWDSFKRIKLSYVSGYQLIGVGFCVKIEGICPILLLLPKFHLVEVLGMLLQSLCFDTTDLEGLVFFFFFSCVPHNLCLILVCFCFFWFP